MSHTHPFAPFMAEAIRHAEKGRWHAAPNPTVGAVLVRDGKVVASGYHTAYGKPHAEVECLRDAANKGIDASQCTLVVTLEPCNHQGKTPPCSHAVHEAGIRRVVIGMRDPNPVAGGGADYLRARGVTVEDGVCEQQCRDLVADFITWKTTDLPYVILKMATTLDGRIATRNGHSQWITCPESRARVHQWRARVGEAGGAVLVGANTLFSDDPQLTARTTPAAARQPLAVIATSRLPRSSDCCRLLRERPKDTIFWTSNATAASPEAERWREVGATVVGLPTLPIARKLDLQHGLAWLRRERGCLHVYCEGGGQLALSLLDAGLVGEFHLHLAPRIIGDSSALPLFQGRAPLHMDEALDLRICHMEPSGEDCVLVLRPRQG